MYSIAAFSPAYVEAVQAEKLRRAAARHHARRAARTDQQAPSPRRPRPRIRRRFALA